MKGRRVYCKPGDILPLMEEPGDYGKDEAGIWYARPPVPGLSAGDLRLHTVVEHDDGTITVTPSILISNNQKLWHGFLIKGEWITC